jgi:hypothetical protein
MIIENEMLHGSLPRGAGGRRNQAPRRTRNPPRPANFPEPAVQPAPEWQPGSGEWDRSMREYQESQARGAAGAIRPHRERIAAETEIVPQAVAAAVCAEAGTWLGAAMPKRWMDELVERAETVYQHNAQFARSLRRRSGRDCLWAFTRHWLFAMLASRRPDLAARLPSSYAIGQDLPPRQHSAPPPAPRRKKPLTTAKSPRPTPSSTQQ